MLLESNKKKTQKKVSTSSGKSLNIDEAISDVGVFAKTKKEESKATKDEVDNRFSDL